VHWRQLGHVLTRKSQLDLEGLPSSCGIYAPTLRHHQGRFYLITTNVRGGGNFYVTARRPQGPWSDPIWIDQEGIDPSLLFDCGSAYYTRNGPGADFDHPLIYQAKLDLSAGKLRGRLRKIWQGTGGVWPEAPHLYRIGRYYYLLTAEGGTSYGHSVVVARSRKPFGPFESCPHNPVLTHRNRRGHPIQATGHADLVELDDGSWWAVFLGIRPRAGRHHHQGRETFLAPVTWSADGWPLIGNRATIELTMPAPALPAAAVPDPPLRDDFDTSKLSPVWNFLRNPRRTDWSLTRRPGHLRLLGSAVSLDDVDSPALVLRRQQHFRVRCRAELDFAPGQPGEEAGLVVRANESFYHALLIRRGETSREARLVRRVRGKSTIVARSVLRSGPIRLEIRADENRYCFRVGVGARTRTLGELPCRDLSAEAIMRAGRNHFTGAYVGMYASGQGTRSSAPADFDWFEYAPGR
jgi:alpha-N-arabinofuranosidase